VGIVGTGFAASAHLDALSRVPGVEVVGVLGRTPERTKDAAARLHVDRAFASLDELLGSVDVMHNCTPNDVHAEVTHAALAAGVHVLSEKPLGVDAAEAATLAVSAASMTDVMTGVCFVYRHFPLVQEMRALLADGADGPIHLAHGVYLQDWLLLSDDWNWRLESPRAGASRAMGDIGSHWIDLLQHVTGEVVTSVHAQLGRAHDTRIRPDGERETFVSGSGSGRPVAIDTEDMALVLFRTASGTRGSVTISQVSAGWKNRLVLEVDAAEASFVWDQEDPNHLRIGRRDGANRDVLRDPTQLGATAARLARYPAGHQEGWPDALRNLFEDFYRPFAGPDDGVRTVASFAEAARVQAVVEAVVRSDAAGVWVEVDDVVKEVSA
jgi:predicted dehydrogenase